MNLNAPQVWIFLPLVAAGLLFIIPSSRWRAFIGAAIAFWLAALANLNLIGNTTAFGVSYIQISPALDILGRRLELGVEDQPILTLLYSMVGLWILLSGMVDAPRKANAGALAITAIYIATLAVQPFLYAALLFEIAALMIIPMLQAHNQPAGRGVIRFLVYQTLAMPFILLSGFFLTGVEASPGDVGLVQQAALLLGLGFGFLLAIFPLNPWVPMLAEESHPYALAFVMLFLPIVGALFGLGFIDRYAWLRNAELLPTILRTMGLVMVATSGLWAAFQRHLGRLFAYAAIFLLGISLLALSLPQQHLALEIFFLLIPPRTIVLILWALGLSILANQTSLQFSELRGLARRYPLASGSILLAHLTSTGMPLLISFPGRQALWEGLARESIGAALVLGLATFGLLFGGLRAMAALVMSPPEQGWESRETPIQRTVFLLGWLALIIPGIFPQWSQPFLAELPNIFQQIGK